YLTIACLPRAEQGKRHDGSHRKITWSRAATMRRYATTDFAATVLGEQPSRVGAEEAGLESAYLRSLTSRLSGANPASVRLKPVVRLLHPSILQRSTRREP